MDMKQRDMKQKGAIALLKDVTRIATASGANLSIAATAVAALGLVTPFIAYRANMIFGGGHGSMSAFSAAPLPAILTLLGFVLAAASWRVPPLMPYRSLSAWAATFMAAGTIAWIWFLNPVMARIQQANQMMRQSPMGDAITVWPHMGMGMLVLAAIIVLVAARRNA